MSNFFVLYFQVVKRKLINKWHLNVNIKFATCCFIMSWIQKGAFRLDLVPTNFIPYGSIFIERYLGQTYLRAVQPIFDESWTNFVQTNSFNLHNHVSRLFFEGQVFLYHMPNIAIISNCLKKRKHTSNHFSTSQSFHEKQIELNFRNEKTNFEIIWANSIS